MTIALSQICVTGWWKAEYQDGENLADEGTLPESIENQLRLHIEADIIMYEVVKQIFEHRMGIMWVKAIFYLQVQYIVPCKTRHMIVCTFV